MSIQIEDAINELRREIRRTALLAVAYKIQAESIRQGDFKSDRNSALEALSLYNEVKKAEESR